MATTRDSILAAATELLDLSGPDGVTLRGVAQIAGLSHNAPYKHFQDKEALLAAVAAQELRARTAVMIAVSAASNDPLSAFQQMAHDHVRWGLKYPNRFGLIFGRWERYDEDLAQAANETLRLFVESIAALRKNDQIRPGDDQRTAAMFMALMHGSINMALSGHLSEDGKGRSDPHGLIDDLIEMLRSN
ncbi:TetR/AcrR family transcriptional regulator [Nitratireductor sp. ZSWI3]|uniref:TetR/AcrR family transcriptional regulator n=1 Tax=Nitratireductor sp. ZSWI3 TaxID=2966359 RepID=UPI00214FBB05|nr:TetR/AcrR family transcriptional regulator [Nitratireductor sp. ZSWI3]MCR4265030.1 TetR/AcrR family transcriptional regulator [Nitratireductor sp. ZSWI3]